MPTPSPIRRRELTDSEREQVIIAVLLRSVEGMPSKGAINEVAAQFAVNRTTVSRIGKSAKEEQEMTSLLRADSRRSERGRPMLDLTSKLEKLRIAPFAQRSTLRSSSAVSGVALATLHRRVQVSAGNDPPEVASFSLPASPARSPTGSDNMSVWVEDAGGEQRVRLSLHSPQRSPSAAPDAAPGTLGDAPDFPLVLWERSTSNYNHSDHLPRPSSAIVPFQKLRLDTNLNQTTLPHRVDESPRSRASSVGSPGSSNGSESPGQRKAKSATQQLASGFLGMETETAAQMSQEFMNALRLGDLTQQEEPQLSVRLRGSRVELASASEDEHVDFLGPAENIKRLFKLPYSQSRVSLAVHRVGSTLVVDGELDENDLPAGFEDLPQDTLQLVQQSEETTQRLLYEKFIYESTVSQLPASETEKVTKEVKEQDQGGVVSKTKTKKHGKRSKKSKKKKQKAAGLEAAAGSENQSHQSSDNVGLLPAVEQGGGEKVSSPMPPPSIAGFTSSWSTGAESSHSEASTTSNAQHTSAPSFIPTEANWFASAAQHSPAFGGDSQTFQRILKWKFNDLKMVLGSQVLLFSNQEHPAVSLKLHDMDKELSLCTVLDYYLDNVIANIPELAICMHSKGLVRGYKLVETRQIPYISGSGRPLFDVQDVSMNASMLLKFLQENCSRPNGTYWLHRKEGESSLRLYDVDVLSQGSQLKWKYMMAMLCYRFAARASRLSNSLAAGTPHLQQQLQQRQRELLRTCMSLLGEIAQKGGTAHSSICSSVSEQLADTYLRECNQFHSSNSADSASADSDRELAIGSLEKAKQYLLASIKLFEECIPNDSGPALTHSDDGTDGGEVIEGEGELTPGDEVGEDEMGSFMDEELNRLQLKFSSACLELGQLYADSRKWVDAVKCMAEASQFLTLSSIPEGVQPLDLSSPDQDPVVDALLDKLDFDGVGRGGFSQDKIAICISGAELRCSLLGLIGDMAAQRPVGVYSLLTALYNIISGMKRGQLPSLAGSTSEFLKTFGDDAELSDSNALVKREEGLMMLSFLAYLRALSPPADSELYFMMMKKLGNASNELGKYFLGARRDYKEAFRWFERGCKIFNDIEDAVNVALLRANLAHLHKIFAQGKPADSREEHYRTAIQLCADALQLLKQSKADADLHRKVKGELALTYLVWAVDMASNISSTGRSPATSRENEALKIFNKALSLYAELGDQKQVASTHYQIASFYSRMISGMLQAERESPAADKSDGSSSTLSSRMEIARRHYEKALNYFGAVEVGKTFVLIHQELADLHILGGRVEGIEHALLILLNTYEAFNLATCRDSKLEKEEMASLARDIVAKVKAVLHQLIRLSSGGNNAHAKSKKLEMFKKMYKEVIYYDGYSAGSIVPILGTLREMYVV
ncbi:hypothetical protein PHYPSEUDO_006318 [Phytophthora pseudosyringae]|uniref:Erythroid differentiation-related factor 1 n=1 Tax=Phytophthora pseudosyringae TaxID=221518 RepID=A0A8T1VMC0_9STRA|nr:hypothetical protein PHYPSEUDO_006318 [Phytophthora pseudosyringae]